MRMNLSTIIYTKYKKTTNNKYKQQQTNTNNNKQTNTNNDKQTNTNNNKHPNLSARDKCSEVLGSTVRAFIGIVLFPYLSKVSGCIVIMNLLSLSAYAM